MSVGALLIILLPLAWEANAAQVPATKELFPSEILLQKTEHFLRWQAFWEGVHSFGGRYRPLAQVKIMIVRSREQAAVFLSDLGLSVTFSEGTDGALLARYGEWRSGDTNESAARRYIRSTAGQPPNRDCVALSGSGQPKPNMQPGTTLPRKRICAESTAGPPFAQEERVFILPELKPPSFDETSVLDGTLDRLRTAIKVNVGQYVGGRIPAARVIVPRFSLEDPYVFVFVDFGAGRQGAIVRFGPERDGSWSGDKLITAGLPNDVGWTVGQVKANAMETIDVP